MDWKTLRRDKLAKAASYKPVDPRDGFWWGAIDRVGDRWARFMVLAWWEKGMVIGTGVLIAVLAPMAVFALSGGDGTSPVVPIPTSTTAPIVVDLGPSATPSPQPSSTPKPVPNTPTSTPTEPANREDCDEIRATDYRSPEERRWFLDNCDLEPEPTDTPVPAPQQPPVPQQPTDTPQPEPSISASQAASLAAGWIRGNPAFGELTVSTGACIPLASGDGWRVGCTGTTNGCVGLACEVTVWVCVSDAGIRQC